MIENRLNWTMSEENIVSLSLIQPSQVNDELKPNIGALF